MFAYSDENVPVDCRPSKVRDVMKPGVEKWSAPSVLSAFVPSLLHATGTTKSDDRSSEEKKTHTVPKS